MKEENFLKIKILIIINKIKLNINKKIIKK